MYVFVVLPAAKEHLANLVARFSKVHIQRHFAVVEVVRKCGIVLFVVVLRGVVDDGERPMTIQRIAAAVWEQRRGNWLDVNSHERVEKLLRESEFLQEESVSVHAVRSFPRPSVPFACVVEVLQFLQNCRALLLSEYGQFVHVAYALWQSLQHSWISRGLH